MTEAILAHELLVLERLARDLPLRWASIDIDLPHGELLKIRNNEAGGTRPIEPAQAPPAP